MDDNQIQGYADAVALAEKRMSPRARRLAWLERWVEGTQYQGKLDWFADAPISQKAPCIVEPVVADSIESHVDMVLGEGRFPVITSRPAEDDSEGEAAEPAAGNLDDEGGLSEEESEAFDRLIVGLCESARFKPLCREALSAALGCGSAAAIYAIRAGRVVGDTAKARWCEPEFAEDQRTVTRLVIEYPYVDVYQDNGVWKSRARVYRREIDDKTDTTYNPADASSQQIKWTIAPNGKIEHNLGFCPVVWYPLMRGCTIVGQYDGHAPHANLTDEIQAHDVALSQRHRAALYAGDPQWTETGVEKGENPSESATEKLPMTAAGGAASTDNPVTGHVQTGNGVRAGRKKHPGTIWQYENENAKVELHSLPGDALESISKHAADLRQKLMQSLAYVPLDPESTQMLRGQLSGKALEALLARQLNRDDKIREDFGENFIKPSVSMMTRICAIRGSGLRVRGLKGATNVIARFMGSADAVG